MVKNHRLIEASVTGATHKRGGSPNQDAIGWANDLDNDLSFILALADGHGGAKSFRSHLGSQMAVQAVLQVIKEWLENRKSSTDKTNFYKDVHELLPKTFVSCWQEKVKSDLADNPISSTELFNLEKKSGQVALSEINENPFLIYGTTILATLITGNELIYWQLGDGDILEVFFDGEVHRPIARDARLFANETTSLCLPDSWRDFQVTISNTTPSLIILSTDGYANSFLDEAGFLQVGTDILEIIRNEGLDTVNKNLSDWLEESTLRGSGDDITVGIVYSWDCVNEI